jgi:hypothetical protein
LSRRIIVSGSDSRRQCSSSASSFSSKVSRANRLGFNMCHRSPATASASSSSQASAGRFSGIVGDGSMSTMASAVIDNRAWRLGISK